VAVNPVVPKSADEEIWDCLSAGSSFILDAGAGSGKTYSLVLALKKLIASHRGAELVRDGQHIACITYTNVARKEIIERTHGNPLLRVSTIHDFLWSTLQPHQKALRQALIGFNDGLPATSARKVDPAGLAQAIDQISVSYSDRGSNFLEGRLHHDDLLSVAKLVYGAHPRLSKIVASQYPFIFVDEYQDTSASVIDALLACLLPTAKEQLVIGFFGDKLQNIYHSGEHKGVGEIPAALQASLKVIVKRENRRCSTSVIDVLNKIRTDINQIPSADNVAGDAIYVRVAGNDPVQALQKARAIISAQPGWNIDGPETRELYLTHKLIAQKAGFSKLLEIFSARSNTAKDNLNSGEDRRIVYFLDKVEPLALAWSKGDIGTTLGLLSAAGHKLASIASKKAIRDDLDKLLALRGNGTVKAVLTHIRGQKLFPLIDDLENRLTNINFVDTSQMDEDAKEREAKEIALYQSLFDLPYKEIVGFASFFMEHTPFATKHGVKGDEFENVLVVLNDQGARWTLYSFDKYLSGEDEAGNVERFRRSRNVFYVCCSRAKQHLAVIDLGGTTATKKARVEDIFGPGRCFEA
jgi:DNA helicase-2/ATP-dependent DNA helicase PcrA